MASFREARVKVAALAVKQYADVAYPSWSAAHPEKPCPDKLEDPKDRSLTFHLRAARRQLEGVVGATEGRALRAAPSIGLPTRRRARMRRRES